MFIIQALQFVSAGRGLAVARTLRTRRPEGLAATIHEVANGRGFLLGGAQGSGKTALLTQVSLHFNKQDNVVAVGPLSLGLVGQYGLDSLGLQLSEWLRDNETLLPVGLSAAYQPAQTDSLEAWLPFLNKLLSEHNADTLLLLLDDLHSVPLEHRALILEAVQNSSWAQIAARTLLGCAGRLQNEEASLIRAAKEGQTKGKRRDGGGGAGSVAVTISKRCALDLYLGLAIALGVNPYAKKKKKKMAKGMGKGWGKYLPSRPGKPGRPGKPALRRGDGNLLGAGGGSRDVFAGGREKPWNLFDEGQEQKQIGKRAKPPTQRSESPGATDRYVNLWFAKEATGESRIDKTRALVLGREVYLRVNIGPLDTRTIVDEPIEFPSDDIIAVNFPETIGKPVPLEATIFSSDFDIPEEARTLKFDLVQGRPTVPLYFPVTPKRNRRARLRLCVFYKNHLLQSLSINADVKKRAGIARNAHAVNVEMSFSADFTSAQRLPARGLWLGINQNDDDTHAINVKNSKTAFSRNLEKKIDTALRLARTALLAVSFDLVKDENGQEKKVYRFSPNNFPLAATQAAQRERFRQDLTKLAVAGNSLYQAIFKFSAGAGEQQTVASTISEIEATLRQEQVIQVSRLKQMEDIWPWAMVYDSPIDPKKVKTVCLSYYTASGALPYSEGVKKCTHRDPVTLRNQDFTVVCPYSFWGFKHIIEQPTQWSRDRETAFAELVLEIDPGAAPVLEMMLESTLEQKNKSHVDNMKALSFKAYNSFPAISAAFDPKSKPPPLEPHVMYFFCHGKSDDEQGGAYLAVGANESLLPSMLNEWNFRWSNSHGLVFINGCHTVDLKPSELSTIMQPFIEAGASGIIGTEIAVTTGLAREFGHEFFKRFLAGDSSKQSNRVGQIIKDLRLSLLLKYNPLGLVYTPYCSADLHVKS